MAHWAFLDYRVVVRPGQTVRNIDIAYQIR
jgi:hypothetical protein